MDVVHFAYDLTSLNLPISPLGSGYEQNVLLDYDGNLFVLAQPEGSSLALKPIHFDGLKHKLTHLTAGFHHFFVLDISGCALGWGSNGNGQLGLTGRGFRAKPVPLSFTFQIAQVSAGMSHSIGLDKDGRVFSWGLNNFGQLGQGDFLNREQPIVVDSLPKIQYVCCGGMSSCTISVDGELFCWGKNTEGQLGVGDLVKEEKHPLPTKIRLPERAAYAAIGGSHMLVVGASGDVYAAGKNGNSQLGLVDQEERRSFVRIPLLSNIKVVSCGLVHSLACSYDGDVYSWGWNFYGQLGQGSTRSFSTPTQISTLPACHFISAGGNNSMAIDCEGNLYFFGSLCFENTESSFCFSHNHIHPKQISGYKFASGQRVKSAAKR